MGDVWSLLSELAVGFIGFNGCGLNLESIGREVTLTTCFSLSYPLQRDKTREGIKRNITVLMCDGVVSVIQKTIQYPMKYNPENRFSICFHPCERCRRGYLSYLISCAVFNMDNGKPRVE